MIDLSIITINYNNELGLKKTIQSVIDQDYSNFEFLVIDGNSTDNSKELLKKYHPSIDFCISEKDYGRYNAMNKGILNSKGEYLLFLNSGDILYNSNIISEFIDKANDEDIIYGNSVMYDDNGNKFNNIEPEILSFKRFFEHSICHQAMFIKRELFSKNRFGLYREDLEIVSDWEFNIRAIINGNCSLKYLNIIISEIEPSGISRTNRELSLKEREIVLKEIFPERILLDYHFFISSLNNKQSSKRKVILLKIIKKLFH